MPKPGAAWADNEALLDWTLRALDEEDEAFVDFDPQREELVPSPFDEPWVMLLARTGNYGPLRAQLRSAADQLNGHLSGLLRTIAESNFSFPRPKRRGRPSRSNDVKFFEEDL